MFTIHLIYECFTQAVTPVEVGRILLNCQLHQIALKMKKKIIFTIGSRTKIISQM